MIPVIPWYITLAVVVGSAVVAFAVWQLFIHSASRNTLPREAQAPVLLGVAASLALWLGLAIFTAPSLASLAGRDPYSITPLIPLFAIAAPLVTFLAYRTSATFRALFNGLPTGGVIGLQAFRLIGALFLVLLAQGQLPEHFARPAGYGDIVVGLSAPLVALAYERGVRWPALLWNVLGVADLLVAVGMGTGLATPLLPGVTSRLPAAAALGAFPMILVPIFAVPIAMMLHVVALRALLGAKERAAEMVMAR